MQADELEELLEHARRHNAANGITGALIYADGVFLQILEGEKHTVQALMEKIAKDFRHETVTVLKQATIPSAVFSDWEMAYVSATPQQIAEWAGLGGATATPDVVTGMRLEPRMATRVAEKILAILKSKP